jgi:hypothetical protein
MGLLMEEKDVDRLKRIAERERAPIDVVGEKPATCSLYLNRQMEADRSTSNWYTCSGNAENSNDRQTIETSYSRYIIQNQSCIIIWKTYSIRSVA